MVLWRPIRPRTNTPKRCPFHYRGLECKSRKLRSTWSNRQIWPWNTEWSRARTNRVLPREYNKHPLPTTHEKTLHMDITRWSTLKSDWLYSLQPKMEKLYTVNKNKTRSWLWLRSWTPYYQNPNMDNIKHCLRCGPTGTLSIAKGIHFHSLQPSRVSLEGSLIVS